jgi:hypothetical protein
MATRTCITKDCTREALLGSNFCTFHDPHVANLGGEDDGVDDKSLIDINDYLCKSSGPGGDDHEGKL